METTSGIRYIRSSAITELTSDYVMVQTAYGASRLVILFQHILKNVMLPIITILGMSLQNLVSGAIITETIFEISPKHYVTCHLYK